MIANLLCILHAQESEHVAALLGRVSRLEADISKAAAQESKLHGEVHRLNLWVHALQASEAHNRLLGLIVSKLYPCSAAIDSADQPDYYLGQVYP